MYVALGVNLDGRKELLGLWLSENEGAKFWLGVMTDMKNRGLRDVFVACIDGLSGFAEAIHAAYPQARVQLCIVHLVRAALRYVSQQDSKAVIADLKKIYTAATVLEAEQALEDFAQAWDGKYPTIAKMWRAKWTDIIAIFDFPPAIREAAKRWTMPIHHWKEALNHFAIMFEDRLPPLTGK
jgi:putative transposase